MDMVFSCRENAFLQAPIKLAQPFPAPELRTNNSTDTRIFLIILERSHFFANTGRACIHTRANTGKYSWGIVYVSWFRARG